MKILLKPAVIAAFSVVMLFGELSSQAPLGIQLVPAAHAIIGLPFTPLSFAGVARRTAFRTAAWTGAAAEETAAADQQAAVARQQASAAEAASYVPPSPPPAAAGKPLPLGTVVSSLPAGCTSTPVGGVDYFYCGGNFYRAAFHGSQLVYVTAKP
jgi:hypothetical protein